jgi:uncharacterized protein
MKMNNKLQIVIDTNVLLVSIAEHSKYHWLFQALLNHQFEALISNEILLEYAEVFTNKMGETTANNTLRTLLNLPNATLITPFYHWNLISQDEDDNKFVDCAIAGNAHYIVSNDKHFNTLKQIEFPKVNVINIDEFYLILNT